MLSFSLSTTAILLLGVLTVLISTTNIDGDASVSLVSAFMGQKGPRRERTRGSNKRTTTTRNSPVVLSMAPKKAAGKKKKAAAAAPVMEPPETLRKKDLVAAVSEELDMTKTDADAAITAVLGLIADCVVEGKRINLAGFGTFEPRARSARKGRNPKTGEEIEIKASMAVGFSAAKAFKDKLNGRAE